MSAPRYAAGTTVSVEQSRAEIERVLTRYGADAFGYHVDGRHARIAFRMKDRHFRFALTLPDRQERRFTHHSRGERTTDAARNEWEQACRSRWRALLLVIKAKLEAVEVGITTLEDEFMASMILPNRETVGEWLKPQIDEAYRIGSMPTTLMLESPSNG